MNENDFKIKYEQDQKFLYAWGCYVKEKIISAIKLTRNPESYLKIPAEPRLKELNSLIEKAYYRDKNYDDPYNDITDKVGIRFVVLLANEISKISEIIENEKTWNYSKDKDYEQEIISNPTTFNYESVHYIVRSKSGIQYNDVQIPPDLPCEIQIRTLLQHAYSELTHDNIYKPKTLAKPDIHRKVARSMALIETTDGIFVEVSEIMSSEQILFDSILPELNKFYFEIAEPEYEKKLNQLIFDALQELFKGTQVVKNIEKFINSNDYIKDIILNRYHQNLLYRQPIILLVLYLINENNNSVHKLWPLTEDELKPLYADLGISSH